MAMRSTRAWLSPAPRPCAFKPGTNGDAIAPTAIPPTAAAAATQFLTMMFLPESRKGRVPPVTACRKSGRAAAAAGRSQRTGLAFSCGRREPRRLDKNDNAWGSSHMPAYFALATSVGLLAVLDTWLFFGPLEATFVAGLVWVSFIAWGCHFHSGGGVKGMTTAIVCMSFG